MSSSLTPMNEPPKDFEREAQAAERGFVRELFAFLRQNRKWWLLPAIIVLLLVGLLGVLGGTALAPFIYTLF
jgi:Family of unknown function (DUF5989)